MKKKNNILSMMYLRWQGIAAYKIMELGQYKFVKIKIVDLYNKNDDSLGYTCRGDGRREKYTATVYVNSEHKITQGMTEEEKVVLIKGVVFHEILHQLLSDFDLLESLKDIKPKFESEILHNIWNIIEDAFIERFAFLFFGGDVLRAIHFTQARIYDNSPVLSTIESPMGQYITALIQYKVFGLLKGNFTEAKTEEVFAKSLDPLDRGVKNRKAKMRMEAAKELLEISKPLWEEDAKAAETFEKFLKELSKALKSMGMPMEGEGDSGGGKPLYIPTVEDSEEADEESDSESTGKSERQKATRKKVGSGSSDGKDEGKDDKDSDDGGDKDSGEDKDGTDDKKKSTDTKERSKEQSGGDSSSVSRSSKHGARPDAVDKKTTGSAYDGETEISNTEAELTDEEIAKVRREIAEAERSKEREDASKTAMSRENLDIDLSKISSQIAKPRSIKNTRIISADNEMADDYREILYPYKSIVKKIAEKFRSIFADSEAEDHEYRRGGNHVDVIRASLGNTPYVFRERIDPKNVGDTSLMLLVDESGSMSCSGRYLTARAAAIVIAEVCRSVGIALGCIGFTADEVGSNTVQHRVYCNFRNNKSEVYSLCSISARHNNMDGASIRYATQMLLKQPTTNKILIVISDGAPACYGYSYTSGVEDTASAVAETRKKGVSVVGIAIDNPDEETYVKMYGKDFVPCNKVPDLPATLCKVLQTEINKRR